MTSTDRSIRTARRSQNLVAEVVAMKRAGVVFFEHDDEQGSYFEALLEGLREGEGQSFESFYQGRLADVSRAKKALKKIMAERDGFADRRRLAAGQCLRCDGRGRIMVHVHSDRAMIDDGWRTCPSCRGTAPEATLPFTADELAAAQDSRAASPWQRDGRTLEAIAAEAEARELFGVDVTVARATLSGYMRRLNAFSAAASVGKGARVRYTNERARAKFWASKDRVPVGTEGVITWVDRDHDGGPAYRYTITTDDGRKFSTSPKNINGIALNGWERATKTDGASEAKREREREDRARMAKVEAASLKVGDKVKNPETGRQVSVFWVGFGRAPNHDPTRMRYGARKGNPIWGYVDELPGAGGEE